jgi:hypothetical protein
MNLVCVILCVLALYSDLKTDLSGEISATFFNLPTLGSSLERCVCVCGGGGKPIAIPLPTDDSTTRTGHTSMVGKGFEPIMKRITENFPDN